MLDQAIISAEINGRHFAPEFGRTETGLVKFPRADTDLRRMILPNIDPAIHPVKANMYMVRELIKYVSEPGELICDPFAGTGTILIGITLGRNIQCIEIEPPYQEAIQAAIYDMSLAYPDIEEHTLVINGDCRKILPLQDFTNHMIFSPPYSSVLKKKGSLDQFTKDAGYGGALEYSASPDNIANLSDFIYFQVMERTYKKFYDSIVSGGTMTVIIKDRITAGKRVPLADKTIKVAVKVGFDLIARHRWEALGGGFAAFNRSIGLETVNEEDLLTFRRVG